MYDEKLLDKLAEVLDELVSKAEGTPPERAEFLRAAMAERDADGNLEEFVAWFE